MLKDAKGNKFIEIDVSEYGKDESLRITKVRDGYNNAPCLRIQIKGEGNKLRPGPEIPIEYADKLVEAIKVYSK